MTDNSETTNMRTPIGINLNRATIVVLGDVLDGLIDKLLEQKEIDEPQAMALWHLENAIEAVCVDSFSPDYSQILAEARKSMGEFE